MKACLQRMRRSIGLLLAAAVTSIAFAAEPAGKSCEESGADIACTAQGAVRGIVEGNMLAFKGLPYAQPPVGKLRWRPPAPPLAWQGVRDGSQFGEMCPQFAGKKVVGAEDCLTLNVWRPQQTTKKLLPVMIWLTGGGNHALSSIGFGGFGGISYNGGTLVPQGVVLVTFNIRLGVLGFLAHAALDAERKEKVSGNYGNLDQIAMLQWVRQNIAAFGGDPQRVMLFGTSAGGGNICGLITSPMARGLFHAAAMQSSVPTGCEIPTLLDVQAGTGQRVVEAVACDAAADVAACLRSKTASQMVSALPASTSVFPRVYGPNMDGHVFPDQPLKIITRREHSAIPIIIGNTTGETTGWVQAGTPIANAEIYAVEIEKVFGSLAKDRILAAYPVTAYPSPQAAFIQLTTDAQFTCTSRRIARIFTASQKQPVYRYLFTHVMENDPQIKELAANHTIEHAFLFPFAGKYVPTDGDLAVQGFLSSYWTGFAKAGNPNGNELPQWPSAAGDAYLEVSTSPAARRGPDAAKCDFWDALPLK